MIEYYVSYIVPSPFQRQKRGLWGKGRNPTTWNLCSTGAHRRVASRELWLQGKQGRAEMSQARVRTARDKATMTRSEDLCLSLRCIGLWNNLSSLKLPKKKWKLVFLPWWDWATCGQPASQESNSGSPLSCQFWPVRNLRIKSRCPNFRLHCYSNFSTSCLLKSYPKTCSHITLNSVPGQLLGFIILDVYLLWSNVFRHLLHFVGKFHWRM